MVKSCNDSFHLGLRVQLNRSVQDVEETLKMSIRVCRSSWSNSFCRAESSVWVTRKCHSNTHSISTTTYHECSLTEDLLCKLQAPQLDWTLSTFVINLKGRLGLTKLKLDPVYVTPLFYMQECPDFRYLSIGRPCQREVGTRQQSNRES